MNYDLLNQLTTKFDDLYGLLESDEPINELDKDKLKKDVSELVEFLESIGGKVNGLQYTKK